VLAIRLALAHFGSFHLTVAPVFQTDNPRCRYIYRSAHWLGHGADAVRCEVVAPTDDIADLLHIIVRAGPSRTSVTIWVTRVDRIIDISSGRSGVDAL
jgi:nitrogen regulatory protein PII